MHRKSKYAALFMLCGLSIFLVVWFYSRKDINERLLLKDREKVRLLRYINSLKEELKVVFKRTVEVEKLLEKERANHKESYEKLSLKNRDNHANIMEMQKAFDAKTNEKDNIFNEIRVKNEEVLRKYLALQHQYVRASEEYKIVSVKSSSDIKTFKQSNYIELSSLESRIDDLNRQRIHYQQLAEKQSKLSTKISKKIIQCQSVLHRNKSANTQIIHNSSSKKRGVSGSKIHTKPLYGRERDKNVSVYNNLSTNIVDAVTRNAFKLPITLSSKYSSIVPKVYSPLDSKFAVKEEAGMIKFHF